MSYFWRVKRPLDRERLLKAKQLLNSTGADHWLRAIARLEQKDQLCDFLAVLMGRPVEKVRKRLTIAGVMMFFEDFGKCREELEELING